MSINTEPNNTEPNEILEIIKGLVLLFSLHAIAGAFIFGLGYVVGMIWGNYTFAGVWIIGAMGFLFWQLLYVLPLTIRFRRRGKIGMMKGVIIGAVITALLNGACFLTFFTP